jgi:hypothetical protein
VKTDGDVTSSCLVLVKGVLAKSCRRPRPGVRHATLDRAQARDDPVQLLVGAGTSRSSTEAALLHRRAPSALRTRRTIPGAFNRRNATGWPARTNNGHPGSCDEAGIHDPRARAPLPLLLRAEARR